MYRIVTENKDQDVIKKIFRRWFCDYTVYNAVGCWKGSEEDSLVIEIEGQSRSCVEGIARDIKSENNQESVLVQEILTSCVFV